MDRFLSYDKKRHPKPINVTEDVNGPMIVHNRLETKSLSVDFDLRRMRGLKSGELWGKREQGSTAWVIEARKHIHEAVQHFVSIDLSITTTSKIVGGTSMTSNMNKMPSLSSANGPHAQLATASISD